MLLGQRRSDSTASPNPSSVGSPVAGGSSARFWDDDTHHASGENTKTRTRSPTLGRKGLPGPGGYFGRAAVDDDKQFDLRRWLIAFGKVKGRSYRRVLVFGGLVVVILWWLFSGGGEQPVREKLDVRWWITDSGAQTIPPDRILLLAPEGLTPDLHSYGPSVALFPYPSPSGPAMHILSTLPSLTTSYLLILSADLTSLQKSYTQTLLHATLTKEYSHAVLSAGGLVLPVLPSSQQQPTCSSAATHDHTTSLHFPTTPFLVETSWLGSLSNGIRTDLPLEVGIALALWRKSAVPSFGIPIEVDEQKKEWGCERVKRELEGHEGLGGAFRRRAAEVGEENAEAGLGEGDTVREKEGVVVLLLSGDDELDAAHELACELAGEKDVRIFVADSESHVGGPQAIFRGKRCHLDVQALGADLPGGSSETESVQLMVVREFDLLPKVEVVIYVVDGGRGREFGEVMKWSEGVFPVRMGGKRRSKKVAEKDGGTVVIPLVKEDLEKSDWIGALPIEALRHWHTPKIDITVVTNDRPASLYRLLSALQDAHYYSDEISLSLNLEQTADRLTQRLVDDFPWPYGAVTLRHRIILGGLMPAIVESWYPASNDTYGVFLEDDVEVSPYFYAWLKFTILYYRYYQPMRDRSSRLFGVSLYQQKNLELRPEGRISFDAHKLFESLSLPSTLPYLSQIPCSWGAVYFPEVWKEFHAYLALRLSETSLPISDTIVPEIRSNKWPRSWKKYFIELVYMRGYVMLYPNFADFFSLSNNHLEKGEHVHVNEVELKKKMQFDVPLMQRNGSILALPEGRLPTWDALPILDLWGSIATDEDIVERGWQSVAQLDTCPPFRLDILPTYNARELLCPKSYTKTNVLVEAQPLAPGKGIAGMGRGGEKKSDGSGDEGEQGAPERPELVAHPDRGGGVGDGDKAEELRRKMMGQAVPRPAAAARGVVEEVVDEEDGDVDDDGRA
ncbi:glycosyl transferase family 2 protein [Pseudohyphozyma bogoriensis]|nr:glycosyl transferase family 2 protein [Pseudohyphozyma bogoriensis]